MNEHTPHRVLVIDDDGDVADVVAAILTDDGYSVSTLVEISHDSLFATVGKLEPDCILLDGSSQVEYGSSWAVPRISRIGSAQSCPDGGKRPRSTLSATASAASAPTITTPTEPVSQRRILRASCVAEAAHHHS